MDKRECQYDVVASLKLFFERRASCVGDARVDIIFSVLHTSRPQLFFSRLEIFFSVCHPSLFMSQQFFFFPLPLFPSPNPQIHPLVLPYSLPGQSCLESEQKRNGRKARETQGDMKKMSLRSTEHRRVSATPVDKEAAERTKENSSFGFCQKENKYGGRGANSNSRARLRKEFPLPKYPNSSGNSRERSRLGGGREEEWPGAETRSSRSRFDGAVREPPKTR